MFRRHAAGLLSRCLTTRPACRRRNGASLGNAGKHPDGQPTRGLPWDQRTRADPHNRPRRCVRRCEVRHGHTSGGLDGHPRAEPCPSCPYPSVMAVRMGRPAGEGERGYGKKDRGLPLTVESINKPRSAMLYTPINRSRRHVVAPGRRESLFQTPNFGCRPRRTNPILPSPPPNPPSGRGGDTTSGPGAWKPPPRAPHPRCSGLGSTVSRLAPRPLAGRAPRPPRQGKLGARTCHSPRQTET